MAERHNFSISFIMSDLKYNNATHNRPEGNRVLDASFVLADLHKYSKQLREEKAWETNDRNAITLFKDEKQTIVLSMFKKNADTGKLDIDGSLTLQVLEGEVELGIGETIAYLTGNSLAVVKEKVTHAIKAVKESLILLTTVHC